MRRTARLLAAAWALAAAGAARAADCAPPLPPGGVIEVLGALADVGKLALAQSLRDGLSATSPDWPIPEIKSAPPCRLAEFQARGATYSLSGGTGRLPPRWATSDGDSWVAYLAVMPSFVEGQAREKMYALVVTNQSMRHVAQLYSGIPSQAALVKDMAAALEQRLPLVADFDPLGRAVSVRWATRSTARAVLWDPLPGQGGQPARVTAADGRLLVATADDGIVMAGSGFRCPARFGDLERMDMWIANATQDRRDLSCRYIKDGDWISIFVTRIPGRPKAREVFAGYLKDGHRVDPPAGTLPLPLALGAPPAPAFGEAWKDARGSGQATWLSSVGDWYVEVRATYRTDRADDIAPAVRAIFEEARASIRDEPRRPVGPVAPD